MDIEQPYSPRRSRDPTEGHVFLRAVPNLRSRKGPEYRYPAPAGLCSFQEWKNFVRDEESFFLNRKNPPRLNDIRKAYRRYKLLQEGWRLLRER